MIVDKELQTLFKSYTKKLEKHEGQEILSTNSSLAMLHKKGLYPYAKRLSSKKYEEELLALQIELLKLQRHTINTKQRVLVIFEGRDAAGKGGTIKRFMQYLNPRHAKVVALSKPNEEERTQWYFQRYVKHLPSAGEFAFYDRSWYNRSGVERVMKFCNQEQLDLFFKQAPEFELMLAQSGIKVIKFWFSVSRLEQLRRFHDRMRSPLKRWKLSPIDIKSLNKWEQYSKAKKEMLEKTSTTENPWTKVRSDDKRRARLEAIRYFLSNFDYPEKDNKLIDKLDKNIIITS